MGNKIAATAIIEEGAKLGDDIEIGHHVIIGKDVEIGDNTIIKSNTVIRGKTKIGKNNTIYQFTTLGEDPQDLKYKGEDTKLIIGDNNKIREYVTMNKGTIASGKTVVGDNNLFMAYAHVAHDCIVGDNCILANAVTLGGHVEVSDWAILGGLTGVHQFVKIGKHVMVGGASAIKKDVMPYVIIDGNDPKVRGINTIGLKRRGFSKKDIYNIKQAFKIIFKSDLRLEEALEKIKNEYSSKFTKLFELFANQSERGIYR
ncbi:MAG: acyl-ACP--UDP-N-acetylglucosamine O-acyltransferase [Fusobacteriota bacterium]